MQIVLLLILLFHTFIYFFPKYYFSELAISFLPYRIPIFLLGAVFSFMKLRKQLKNKPRKASIRSAILVGLCIFFVMYSNKFNTFYHPLPSSETESGIKILYANIHKNNTDYTGIKETIKTANPDMILFVEFSENHYNHLKDFLQKDYPYINSTTRSQKFIGSMVFSKYKIENRADDFPQGRRRYAYFSIKPGDQKYYIYLVHTSSPDSYEHFIMRNNQLITFTQDFQIHAQKHRQENDKVIVIGDFNVSPRSLFYQNFQA